MKKALLYTAALPFRQTPRSDRAIGTLTTKPTKKPSLASMRCQIRRNRGDRNDARYMARAMLNENMNFSALSFLREIILDGLATGTMSRRLVIFSRRETGSVTISTCRTSSTENMATPSVILVWPDR